MSLAVDIKGILQDTGARLKILRDSGHLSGEYCGFKPNSQATKPFIREHFLEGQIPYDSDIVAGDVLEDDFGDRYLAMNITERILENTSVKKDTVFYKCNVSGELLRISGEVRNATSYKVETVYQSVKTDCYALMTDTSAGTDVLQEEEIGQIETTVLSLFIPHSVGVQSLDFYVPHSGEYYKVESIESRRFPAIDVCKLTESTIVQ